MRLLWTLVKVVIALAIAIPLCIVALGILGATIGIAFVALRIAVVALIAYGVYRVVRRLIVGPSASAPVSAPRELPAVDPHYEAAMRELDRELGEVPRK